MQIENELRGGYKGAHRNSNVSHRANAFACKQDAKLHLAGIPCDGFDSSTHHADARGTSLCCHSSCAIRHTLLPACCPLQTAWHIVTRKPCRSVQWQPTSAEPSKVVAARLRKPRSGPFGPVLTLDGNLVGSAAHEPCLVASQFEHPGERMASWNGSSSLLSHRESCCDPANVPFEGLPRGLGRPRSQLSQALRLNGPNKSLIGMPSLPAKKPRYGIPPQGKPVAGAPVFATAQPVAWASSAPSLYTQPERCDPCLRPPLPPSPAGQRHGGTLGMKPGDGFLNGSHHEGHALGSSAMAALHWKLSSRPLQDGVAAHATPHFPLQGSPLPTVKRWPMAGSKRPAE